MRRRGPAAAVVIALATLGISPNFDNGRAAFAATHILPDLAMVPPFQFRIEVTSSGRKHLRFTTVVANVGAGPFHIYGYDSNGAKIGDTLAVRQSIKRSDGFWSVRETTARMSYAGADGHNHWHVKDYQRFRLENLDLEPVGSVRKTGFCALDSYHYGSSKPALYDSSRSICQVNRSGRVLMGTSRKWGDVYRWNIAFQWVDITGVPNGTYKLWTIADPPWESGGRFIESDETNNRAWARIRISGTTVTVLSKSPKP